MSGRRVKRATPSYRRQYTLLHAFHLRFDEHYSIFVATHFFALRDFRGSVSLPLSSISQLDLQIINAKSENGIYTNAKEGIHHEGYATHAPRSA